MDWLPTSCHKEYFREGLRALCDAGAPTQKLYVASQGALPEVKRRSSFRCDAAPRLHVMVNGHHRLSGLFSGCFSEIDLNPGDAFFLPPFTLSQELWSKPCFYFGIVFRPAMTRYLVVDYLGGRPPIGSTPWAFHVNRPLSAPAHYLLESLCAFTTTTHPDSITLRQLSSALLRLALEHLELEATPTKPATKSYHTWQLVQEFLLSHYDRPISRDDVAKAVGIHPNYLSALCQQHACRSFHDLLETTRLDRAKTILQQTNWKLEQVARHCGYVSAAYFVRVFKQSTHQTPGQYRRSTPRKP